MMIRKGMMFGGSVAAIALFAGSALAVAKPTPTPLAYPFPAKGATMYKTTFARAMDVCLDAPGEFTPGPWGPGVVTVQITGGGVGGLPRMGCVASPDNTDAMQFGKAQLVLNKAHGKYILNGIGFPADTLVDLVLNVQVTRKLVHTDNQGVKNVTFPVQTATCATVTVDAKGKLLQKGFLDSCLAYQLVDPTPGEGTGGTENSKFSMVNIEVQSATLVDHVTTKTIGTAGIVR